MLASLLVATTLLAAEPGDALKALELPFTRYTLPNGLTVILSPSHTVPTVAVEVWYKVGAAQEEQGRSGFAHLFEHMMFQGSAHVGDDRHFALLEAAGASDLNGSTNYDRTNYYEVVPAHQLELALWLESDRMGWLTISQQKLDNQRAVVQEERRQQIENRPYGASSEQLIQSVYAPTHPYYGMVIGSMKDLNAATLEDVQSFYDRYYAPRNAVLVVVGDIEIESTKALIQKYFGTLPDRAVGPSRVVPDPRIPAEKRVDVTENVQLPRVHMAWVSPKPFAKDDYICDILASVLGEGRQSRLHKRLVHDLQIAQSATADQSSHSLGSVFTIMATARPGVSAAKLEAEMQKVLDELVGDKPPTERELTAAKNSIITDHMAELQTVGARADTLAFFTHYTGNPGYVREWIGTYQTITSADVQRVAKELLVKDHRVILTTVPLPQVGQN
ncbi:MAG: M16 family metallopeptidase [Myxococcota bacterium]